MTKLNDLEKETKKKFCGNCKFWRPTQSNTVSGNFVGYCDRTGEKMGYENLCQDDKWQSRYSWLDLHPKTKGFMIFIGSGVFTISGVILGYLLSRI